MNSNFKEIKPTSGPDPFWWRFVPDWFVEFTLSSQRLLSWVPVIWKDQEWDFTYLLRIIDHKLGRMEEFYRGPTAVTDSCLESADQIAAIREAVTRLIKDDYMHPDLVEYYATHDATTLDQPMSSEHRKLLTRSWAWEARRRKADETAVFLGLRKHYRNWWD